jgi:hypothetical protein
MKKLLVVLLALMAFGMFAFAQDEAAAAPTMKFIGWNRYGVQLANQVGEQVQNPSWAGNGNCLRIGVDYNHTTFGVNGQAYIYGGIIPESLNDYTAWIKPFSFITVSVGKLQNGDYRLANFDDGGFAARWTQGYALAIQAYPVEGLTLGIANPIAQGTAQAFDAGALAFAGSYLIPDIAKILVQYKGESDLNSDGKAMQFAVGTDIKAVQNLGLLLGYTYTAAYTNADGATTAAEVGTINYNVSYGGLLDGKLSPSAYGAYKVTAGVYNMKVNVAYDLGVVTPSVYGAFNTADNSSIDWGFYLGLPANGSTLKIGVDGSTNPAVTGSTTFAVRMYWDLSF